MILQVEGIFIQMNRQCDLLFILFYSIGLYIYQFDRWRACEQHRDNTADKLLLTTVDMDCIEYWNLYSN